MSTTEVIIALGIGIISGTIAALCGVGGGVVMVPAFVLLLGLQQKTAVATSLAVIIPTALMATMQNAKNGLLTGTWKLAVITAISASVLAWFGADWLKRLSNESLTRVFGVLLVVMGARMLLQGKA